MAQHELSAVEGRGVHAHQQLRRSGLGHRCLAQIEHGFRVGHLHPVGLHLCLPNVMFGGVCSDAIRTNRVRRTEVEHMKMSRIDLARLLALACQEWP